MAKTMAELLRVDVMDEEVTQWIKAHPKQISKKDSNGVTPLGMAAMCDRPSILCLLLEAEADVNVLSLIELERKGAQSWTCLHLASHFSAVCGGLIIKYMIDKNLKSDLLCKEDKLRATPMHVAAIHNNFSLCQFLLAAGADRTLSVKTAEGLPEEQGYKCTEDTRKYLRAYRQAIESKNICLLMDT